MIELILKLLSNDVFWIGFAVGFVICGIVSFILECLCIVSGKSDIDTWMVEDDE